MYDKEWVDLDGWEAWRALQVALYDYITLYYKDDTKFMVDVIIWIKVTICVCMFSHCLPLFDLSMFLLSVKASPPGVPNLDKIGKNYADLSWTKPRSDGGSPIKGSLISDYTNILPIFIFTSNRIMDISNSL